MTGSRLDELAEVARNRGLKLVRSRVRTPGKPGFGKVGLSDKTGKAVFAMGPEGPNGTPDSVDDYLRSVTAKDWGQSLGESGPRRRRVREPEGLATAIEPPRKKETRSSPTDVPEAAPRVRPARSEDASSIAALLDYLGHPIHPGEVRKNLLALEKTGETPLVAVRGDRVIGLCGVGKRVVIARPFPVGRITSLVVERKEQGKGVGRMLVGAAEEEMRKAGCKLVEVTSNDRLAQAHAFYRHMGYERTSIRFAKSLK